MSEKRTKRTERFPEETEEKQMQEERISVVVPVYKVEPYLQACVRSILSQTYENMEILLVDDGSPDNCPAICDRFAEEDARVRVFHKPNGGLSDARNYALDRMTGEYVTFIDSDDFIAPDYLARLYRLLKENDADISVCGVQNIPESELAGFAGFRDDTEQKPSDAQTCVYTAEEALRAMLYQVPFDNSAWGKLYRKELFAHLRFPVGYWYEDFAVMPQIFLQAKRVCFHPYRGYGYLLRKEGIVRRSFSEKKMQLIDLADKLEGIVLSDYPRLQPAVNSRIVRANMHIYSQIPLEAQYKPFRDRIAANIRSRRKAVLADPEARLGTKLALCMTYFGVGSIRLFHKLKDLAK